MVVADVGVYQLTGGADGGGGSAENEVATSTRLQTKDQFDITDIDFPIPIPAAGFYYSYWIHVYLKIENIQDATRINNVVLFCDGSIDWTFGAGGELRVGQKDDAGAVDAGHGCPMDADYDLATGTEGTTGHTIEDGANGHGYYIGETPEILDIENYVTGARMLVDSTNHDAGGKCKAAVLQVKLDTAGNGAVQGLQADETLTFAYDEI